MNIKTFLNDECAAVETAMAQFMPEATGLFARHIEAMRYSLFAGGKRIRPILCLAAAASITESPKTRNDLLPVACALEFIHTYSLIHDDLPAMDDDALRRGKPTNHILFGEAAAILAGDGLLTDAFSLLSRPQQSGLPADTQLRIVHAVATAAGSFGMVGGQALDIANEQTEISFDLLQSIHKSKTGALITCAVEIGGIGAGASEHQLKSLISYGNHLGLAFQIVDDLLNATSTTEQLGKAAGSDAQRGKSTYPAYFGIDTTRTLARDAVDMAIHALEEFDHKAAPLRELAEYIYTRSH